MSDKKYSVNFATAKGNLPVGALARPAEALSFTIPTSIMSPHPCFDRANRRERTRRAAAAIDHVARCALPAMFVAIDLLRVC